MQLVIQLDLAPEGPALGGSLKIAVIKKKEKVGVAVTFDRFTIFTPV